MNKVDRLLLGIVAFFLLAGGVLVYVFFTNPAAFTDSSTPSAPSPPPVVIYDDKNGFTPKTVTIRLGQTVEFRNERSARPMWVASTPHPAHTDYAAFDQGKVLGRLPKVGENFKFTFEKTGTWTYHDHADPTKTGTIIVE